MYMTLSSVRSWAFDAKILLTVNSRAHSMYSRNQEYVIMLLLLLLLLVYFFNVCQIVLNTIWVWVQVLCFAVTGQFKWRKSILFDINLLFTDATNSLICFNKNTCSFSWNQFHDKFFSPFKQFSEYFNVKKNYQIQNEKTLPIKISSFIPNKHKKKKKTANRIYCV